VTQTTLSTFPRPVRLCAPEVRAAVSYACDRQISAIAHGRNADNHGPTADSAWGLHIVGTLGEMAVAKMLGIYWPEDFGRLDTHTGDVGPYQVRATLRTSGRLIVHDDDDDEAIFYLVTGMPPVLTVQGWLTGRDAKQRQFRTDPVGGRPAYFVPVPDLNKYSVNT
jgi:hypothetical protein